MKITLGKAMIDWLTVTSFQETSAEYWRGQVDSALPGDWQRDVHIPRYVGMSKESQQGHVWIGEGIQKEKAHYMITCGGQNAHELAIGCLIEPYRQGWSKPTVIHIQITLNCGKTWNQRELYQRLESRGKRPSNWSSLDNEGRERTTVYVGSMKSSKYSRTYVKDIGKDGSFIIRHEIVYKGAYALGLMKSLDKTCDYDVVLAKVLWRDIVRLDDKFAEFVAPYLARFGKEKVKPEHHELDLLQTKRAWLLGSVLPAFTAYINDHDADDAVMDVFAASINNVYYGRNEEE